MFMVMVMMIVIAMKIVMVVGDFFYLFFYIGNEDNYE